jgi:cytochrome c oxidase subunit IV
LADDSESTGVVEKVEAAGTELERAVESHLSPTDTQAPVEMLPGEISPHPTPLKYVVIAVVLVVLTAIEVAVSYQSDNAPEGVIVALLLLLAAAKFTMVASWYMHLKTDKPIFRRFFILGIVAAITLFAIVLATLHAFAGGS